MQRKECIERDKENIENFMGVPESLFYNIGIGIYRAKRGNEGDASLRGHGPRVLSIRTRVVFEIGQKHEILKESQGKWQDTDITVTIAPLCPINTDKMLYILFLSLYAFFPLHINKHFTDLSFRAATSKNPSGVPLTFPHWVCAVSPSCLVPRAPAHPALSREPQLSLPDLRSPGSFYPVSGTWFIQLASGNPSCHTFKCPSKMLVRKRRIQLGKSSTQTQPDLPEPRHWRHLWNTWSIDVDMVSINSNIYQENHHPKS